MSELVPNKYSARVEMSVDGYLAVWRAGLPDGLVVLGGQAEKIYRRCNGKRKVEEMLPTETGECIQKVLTKLDAKGVIVWQKPVQTREEMWGKPKYLGVWMHLTNQCNLRCKYCYVHKTCEVMQRGVMRRAIERVLVSAKKQGIEEVKFKYSGGEALLDFAKVKEGVCWARRKGKELGIETKHAVLTNAVLLTKRIAEELAQKEIQVMVSLDGVKRHHNLVRVFPGGGGTYDQVVRGIKNLQAAKTKFNVSVTITKDNLEGIPELTEWLLRQGIRFNFNFFRENCEAGNEYGLDNRRLIKGLRQAIQVIENQLPDYPIWDSLLDRVNLARARPNGCGVGRNYLAIDQNGRLGACQVAMDWPMGGIEDEIVTALKSKSFMTGITVDEKAGCADCVYRYACGGGCPLVTKAAKGSWQESSPYCAVYRSLIPELIRLEAKRIIKYAKIAK